MILGSLSHGIFRGASTVARNDRQQRQHRGSDLALYVRQDPQHRTVPIILSALAKEKLQSETARGADLYLKKPVAVDIGLGAIKSCIETARRRGTIMPIEVVVS